MKIVICKLTLCGLSADEGLDESIGGLRVERQGIAKGQELGTLVQEGLLKATAPSVEVLLDRVQRHVQHRTLFGT